MSDINTKLITLYNNRDHDEVLTVSLAEIERLHGDAHILRKAHSELCANNKHMSSQIKTKNRIISDQHAEIERLHKELAEKDDYIRTVSRPIGAHNYE
jgi:uncharacterized small protein (DUF1192 family)